MPTDRIVGGPGALGSAVTAEWRWIIRWLLPISNAILVLAIIGIVIADGSIPYWEIPGLLILPAATVLILYLARTNRLGP